ncbi:hypothetical protein AB0N23_37020, partial [Streptomyces sp. NPDC052644]
EKVLREVYEVPVGEGSPFVVTDFPTAELVKTDGGTSSSAPYLSGMTRSPTRVTGGFQRVLRRTSEKAVTVARHPASADRAGVATRVGRLAETQID